MSRLGGRVCLAIHSDATGPALLYHYVPVTLLAEPPEVADIEA